MIIENYHDKFTSILGKYFGEMKTKVPTGSSEEPANISAPIFKIAQMIYHELLVDLGVSFNTQKFGQNIDLLISLVEKAPKPELLTKSKKFSQMEMEMDKFLAKKSIIYNKAIF